MNFYLKNTITSVIHSLSLFFEESFINKFISEIRKTSTPTPVHKKGASNCVANYRSISLTPVVSKLIERVIDDQLSDYLYSNHILSPHKFGFKRNSSTVHQLIDA